MSQDEAQEDEKDDEDDDAPPAWYERLRFSGDFRSRYEGFYRKDSVTRNRARMRLRLRVDSQINDDVRFQFQVASGDPGTPTSTNQTFSKFFQPKAFNLDRAYLAYNPASFTPMTLGMGKFGAPQLRTQMTFDDDLNYEGGWERFVWETDGGIGFSAGALQTAVNEASRGSDSYMLAGFGGVTFDIGKQSFEITAANYGWGNVDAVARAQASGELSSILTNVVVRDDNGMITGYASRFNVVDIIGETTFETGRSGYPLRVLVEYARNTRAANDRDSGFWVEAEYGNPREAGQWGATYTYGWIEQDLTPSAFVFSDIPGTNIYLHMVETSYFLKPALSFDVTLHLTKRPYLPDPQLNNSLLTRLHVGVVARF